jgi:monosaccharide-transporting ATPase
MSGPGHPILRVNELTKRFPGVLALDRVSIELRPGEVHALVGENGAGKSTLIKVITGAYRPDGGQILLRDEEVDFKSPADSQQAGISTIYQEVNLIPMRSVTDNIFLGREHRTRAGLLDRRRMRREARDLLARFGVDVDVSVPLGSLGMGTQQMVAIARAVDEDARILIMDEPTSSLHAREVETLFGVVRQLQDRGVAVVYVSHRLDELYELCDAVTVLRDGRVVHDGPLAQLPRLELIAAMLGRDLPDVQDGVTEFEHHDFASGPTVLTAQGLRSERLPVDVSLEVRKGSIVGLAGLLGSGRTETAKALFGARPLDEGTIEIDGEPVTLRGPASAVKAGLAYLSEDRKAEGIIPDLSVRENIVAALLPRLSRAGLVSDHRIDEIADRFIADLGIKASSPNQAVRELSGGNQQKVLLARWLCMNPKLLILDEPTRGIDIGAKAEVRQVINELSAGGMSVLLISSETEELVEGCSSVVVLRDGRSVARIGGAQLTEGALVNAFAGTTGTTPGGAA